MVLKINPNQQPLWRDPFELQIGVGKNAIRLGKLSPAQERLIATLYKGIADQQLPLVQKQLGLSDSETTDVIDRVGGALLIEPPADSKLKLSDDFVAGAFADIIRASLLHSVDGEAVLIGRGERTVFIDDLSRAGLSVALGLAAAGVGHLLSSDEAKVDAVNIGPVGYPSQFAGHPRIDALRSLLAASPNGMKVASSIGFPENKLQKVDCAILIGQQVIDPKRYERWLGREVAHIAVTFDSNFVSVSPMIIPGASACLLCLEKARTKKDSKWPVLASQMITSQKRFDDVASALFAAGLVIQKILATADEIAGFTVAPPKSVGYQLELASGLLTEFTWPASTDCECKEKAH